MTPVEGGTQHKALVRKGGLRTKKEIGVVIAYLVARIGHLDLLPLIVTASHNGITVIGRVGVGDPQDLGIIQIAYVVALIHPGASFGIAPELDEVDAGSDLCQPRPVPGKVHRHIPYQVVGFYRHTPHHELPSAALDEAGIDVHTAEPRRGGDGYVADDLVLVVDIIIGTVKMETVAEKTYLRTHLPRGSLLRLQVGCQDRPRLGQPCGIAPLADIRVGRIELIRGRIVTHGSPAATHLEHVHIVTHVQDLVQQHAQRDRGIEIRPALGRQRARPVITGRQIEVDHAVEREIGRSVDAVDRFLTQTAPVVQRTALDVPHIVNVGHDKTGTRFRGLPGRGAFAVQGISSCRDRHTQLPEFLVERGQEVGVAFIVLDIDDAVSPVVGLFGIAGRYFRLAPFAIAVDGITSPQAQLGQQLPLESQVAVDTVAVEAVVHLIRQEIGVVILSVGRSTLLQSLLSRLPVLFQLTDGDVQRHLICPLQRVGSPVAGRTVVGPGVRHTDVGREGKLIIGMDVRADGQVVAVQVRSRHDAPVGHVRHRDAVVGHLCAVHDRSPVGGGDARLDKIRHIIGIGDQRDGYLVAVGIERTVPLDGKIPFVTLGTGAGSLCRVDYQRPADDIRSEREITGRKMFLRLKIFVGHIKDGVRTDVHRHTLALPAFFCGDQHHAVAGTRTVEGRSTGPLEDRDALNIVGVKVGDGIAVVDDVAVAYLTGVVETVDHRHAIHHEQRLVVAAQGGGPADHHAHRRACTARSVDRHPRHLAGQRVDHILLDHLVQLIPVHLAYGKTQRFLLPGDAQGCHHHLIQTLHLLPHHHINDTAVTYRDLLRLKTDKRKNQCDTGTGDTDRILAIRIGDGTIGGAFLHDRHPG